MPSTSRSSGWPPHSSGHGYWLVASDGGVFTSGTRTSTARPARIAPQQTDRRDGRHTRRPRATGWSPPTAASSRSATRTSTARPARMRLNKPIVGMAATPIGHGLLAGRVRRRHLRLRRRALLRLDRRDDPQQADRRHGRTHRRPAATGWSPPTAGSSLSATHTSRARPDRASAEPDRRDRPEPAVTTCSSRPTDGRSGSDPRSRSGTRDRGWPRAGLTVAPGRAMMPTMSERFEVQRTIPADAAAIFRVVCDPQGHVAIDAPACCRARPASPPGRSATRS